MPCLGIVQVSGLQNREVSNIEEGGGVLILKGSGSCIQDLLAVCYKEAVR